MGNFFHGWRRKIGVLTLVMACLLVAGWVRSDILEDTLLIRFGNHFIAFVSEYGSIQFGTFDRAGHGIFGADYRNLTWAWKTRASSEFDDTIMNSWITTGPTQDIPYWSVVIPLTLLSAWLLLSEPRPSIQTKTADLVPEKVS